MNNVMNWAVVFMAAMAVIAIVGVAVDEVRARVTQPKAPSPLSGIGVGDGLLAVGFFGPVLFAGWLTLPYL